MVHVGDRGRRWGWGWRWRNRLLAADAGDNGATSALLHANAWIAPPTTYLRNVKRDVHSWNRGRVWANCGRLCVSKLCRCSKEYRLRTGLAAAKAIRQVQPLLAVQASNRGGAHLGEGLGAG